MGVFFHGRAVSTLGWRKPWKSCRMLLHQMPTLSKTLWKSMDNKSHARQPSISTVMLSAERRNCPWRDQTLQWNIHHLKDRFPNRKFPYASGIFSASHFWLPGSVSHEYPINVPLYTTFLRWKISWTFGDLVRPAASGDSQRPQSRYPGQCHLLWQCQQGCRYRPGPMVQVASATAHKGTFSTVDGFGFGCYR